MSVITYEQTRAEIDGGVAPSDYAHPPGDVRRYGALPDSTSDLGPSLQQAVNQAIHGGAPVYLPPGTYRQTTSVVADGFTGLRIHGYAATIDFRVDSAIKLGDHTINGSAQFAATKPSAFDIVIEGIKFKPGANGWDGDRFAWAEPINLSAVQNVVVRDCQFEDWDFAAISVNAPSKHVLVERCRFSASEESHVTYGVRPFAHVVGMSTDNYDESNGTLAEPAPALYHEDITIRDCYFYQCSHAILSANVHGFSYVNNVIEKPTVRTISATTWSFDGLIQGNRHLVANNAAETVSTCVAVGVGSQRVTISDEQFLGALSGTPPNDSMKIVDLTAVLEGIRVQGCVFDLANPLNAVLIGPNVEATIEANVFKRDPRGAVATIVINDQTASPVASPGFSQPRIRIVHNVDVASTRFVELANAPPGGTRANGIIVQGNTFHTRLSDGLVVTNTASAGWKARATENSFAGGAPTYYADFGAAKTVFDERDNEVVSSSSTIDSPED